MLRGWPLPPLEDLVWGAGFVVRVVAVGVGLARFGLPWGGEPEDVRGGRGVCAWGVDEPLGGFSGVLPVVEGFAGPGD
ncbi:hypothetical protein F4815DRAFT_476812 [Daldinia loculata]|nr:hypothetical protein F4815DRAFT_476812 [Daldinia loculata]